MKHFCISDIHGCGDELKKLLDLMSPVSSDQIILCGDLFDRGFNSCRVWQTCQEGNVVAVLGNHEKKIKEWLLGTRQMLPQHYYVALNSLVESGVSPDEILAYLEGLPLMRDYGDFIVSHAGVSISNPLVEDISMNVYGNDRSGVSFWDRWEGPQLVIYGHNVTGDGFPRIRRARGRVVSVGLDGGCVHGGNLLGMCVETGEFFSIASEDYYSRMMVEVRAVAPVVNTALVEFIVKNRSSHVAS